MALTGFDDDTLPLLVTHIGGGSGQSGVVYSSGDIVESVTPFVGDTVEPVTSIDARITHTLSGDATTKIGQLPAFIVPGTGEDSSLLVDYAPPEPPTYPFSCDAGVTIVIVEQRETTSSTNAVSVELNGSTTAATMRIVRSGSFYRWTAANNSVTTTTTLDTNPRVLILTHNGNVGGDNGANCYIDNVPTERPSNNPPSFGDVYTIHWGNDENGASSVNGRLGLLAVYAGGVDAQQASDLYDLCQDWIADGAGPTPGVAPVLSPDLPATSAALVGGEVTLTSGESVSNPTATLSWLTADAATPTVWEDTTTYFEGQGSTVSITDAECTISNLTLAADQSQTRLEAVNTVATVSTTPSVFSVTASLQSTGKFHANTNDATNPNVALTWEWSSTGNDVDPWFPATGIGGLSDAEYLNEKGQDNDTLNVITGDMSDNGWVRCVATVEYMDGPVYSQKAQLTVVEASS